MQKVAFYTMQGEALKAIERIKERVYIEWYKKKKELALLGKLKKTTSLIVDNLLSFFAFALFVCV